MIEALILQAALGAASKLSAEAVAKRAGRVATALKARQQKLKDEDIAKLAVEHVLEEAAGFPPKKAVGVFLEASLGDGERIGVVEPDRLGVAIRFWNRADFEIQLANIRGNVILTRLDGASTSYEFERPDQFDIDARCDRRIATMAFLRRGEFAPQFQHGSVVATSNVEVTVLGPWPDEPGNRHTFSPQRIWMPVAPDQLMRSEYDNEDARSIIEKWVSDQTISAIHSFDTALHDPIDLIRLEETLRLPRGSVEGILPGVLVDAGWTIKRQGARTIAVQPGPELRLRIETGM